MSRSRSWSVRRSAGRGALAVALAVALVGVVGPSQAFAAAPANDYVNRATPVSSLPFSDTVDTREATLGAADAAATCESNDSAATVWYRFTPTTSGTFAFSTTGSDYDTVVNLFSGRADDLTWLACNDDFETTAAVLVRPLVAGTTYFVSAGTCCTAVPGPGPGGTLRFSVARTRPVDVHVTVAPKARLHADQHRASFHGTISCGVAATYHLIGYVEQQQAGAEAFGLFEVFGSCTAGSSTWSAVGTSLDRPWWQKTASVHGDVTACSSYVCGDASFGPVAVRMARAGSVARGTAGLR
jgi:hypothetical protein